jgi:hypothetical protein
MMDTEKYLFNILDQMISTSRKLYRAKDDATMYEYHANEMDELRDEFFLALQRLPKDDRFVFIIETLETNKKRLKGETLAVKAILLDELGRF